MNLFSLFLFQITEVNCIPSHRMTLFSVLISGPTGCGRYARLSEAEIFHNSLDCKALSGLHP